MANPKTGLKLSKSWKTFDRECKIRNHKSSLKKHIKPATIKVGQKVRAEMKRQVQQGSYQKNAALTRTLKGHGHPLNHTGNLRDSIAAKMLSSHRVFIGILKSDPQFKYAKTVHGYNSRGAALPVTKKMRNMFQLLEDVYLGKRPASILTGRPAELWARYKGPWSALHPSTTVIRVPARPFVKHTVMNKNLLKAVRKIWQDAIMQNYREIAQRVNRGSKSF